MMVRTRDYDIEVTGTNAEQVKSVFSEAITNLAKSSSKTIGGSDVLSQQVAGIGSRTKTILFLGSNPRESKRLRMDDEIKRIEQGLERSKRRDQFKIVQRWAATIDDLRRAILDHEPEIVHFAGHGSGRGEGDHCRDMVLGGKNHGGLAFEDQIGQVQHISGEFLARLFELCADRVRCVVLNACYSEDQADAIARHIDYVIGMKAEIEDESAITFAVGFYDALGAGKDYEKAFKFGCSAIDPKTSPDYMTPVLKQ
jgi:hypothetical protein